jgi:hypothetical protein
MDVVGDYASAKIEITIDRPIVWLATADRIETFRAQKESAEGVTGALVIPQNYQEGFVEARDPSVAVEGWYYTARVTVTRGRENLPAYVKRFQIAEGQTEIDLDLIPDNGTVTPPVTAPLVPVTSVNGMTGAVTVDSGSLTEDPDHPSYYAAEGVDGLVATVDEDLNLPQPSRVALTQSPEFTESVKAAARRLALIFSS